MSRWIGRLERRDLEGGIWVLHAPGVAWTLHGDIPPDLADARVEVEGEGEVEAEADGFGFAMTGPSLRVRRIRRA